MKKLWIIFFIFVVLIGAFYALNSYIYNQKQGEQKSTRDYKNATYVIDGRPVALVDGNSETEVAPGSASKVITRYFGNEARGDFDRDGREDIVFLLTQQTGGSGTFYYVVAALNKESGYEGSQAFFLGDRIAPQTTEAREDGSIVVNYADRAPGESFTVQPSIGKSAFLKLDASTMELKQDIQGEITGQSLLQSKTWTWIKALYNDGREVVPKKAGVFRLTFGKDGRFSATTDCNSMGGAYGVEGNRLTFSDMVSTKMYCEGSDESVFAELLSNTSGYHASPDGQLILDLKFDSGSVVFQ